MHLEKLTDMIAELLPPDTAMEGDRLGLQIQSGKLEINRILITLELDGHVVEEAEKQKIDCIVAFHPLIYRPLTYIHENERVGRLTTKLIRSGIALISVHTAFDAYGRGTSSIIARLLGLRKTGFIAPDEKHEGRGMGVVAVPEAPLAPEELLEKVAAVMNSPLRYCEGKDKKIETIGIVGGSGTSFLNNVEALGLDAFITADITYHTFHAVKGSLMLIDPGHYEMEQFVPAGLAELLRESLDGYGVEINLSEALTNPVKYYPENDYALKQNKYLIQTKNKW